MLVKMPCSNFKDIPYALGLGVRNCSCGQIFAYTSERDRELKILLHHKFCSKPPKGTYEIGVSKARPVEKAKTLKEYYNDEPEVMRKLYE